jgi:hypothetical protein
MDNAKVSKLYRDAWMVQSACNLSGVAISFGAAMQDICKERTWFEEARGIHLDLRIHPVVYMFMATLSEMVGTILDSERYHLAYNFVREVMGGVEVGSDAYVELMTKYQADVATMIRRRVEAYQATENADDATGGESDHPGGDAERAA